MSTFFGALRGAVGAEGSVVPVRRVDRIALARINRKDAASPAHFLYDRAPNERPIGRMRSLDPHSLPICKWTSAHSRVTDQLSGCDVDGPADRMSIQGVKVTCIDCG
jgi:hypothetical protein